MPNVTVIWGPAQEQAITAETAMPQAEARAWLDAQYLAFDCQPQRASGKVLVADKLLSIVDAAGEQQFADKAWALLFAAAAAGSTGRDTVGIDVIRRTMRY